LIFKSLIDYLSKKLWVRYFPLIVTSYNIFAGKNPRLMPLNPNHQVLIRPAQPGDGAAFLAAVRRSRALHACWIAVKAKTPEEFTAYLQRYTSDRHCGHLVIHRGSGDLIGVINLNEIIRGAFPSASLGYYAFMPYAGQGLMHAGLRLVLRHAFGKLKLHRVEANIQPDNRASIALVQKCGFVCEGRGRHLLKVRGRWRDHERWALLVEEFK
jgi:ribosomal-protein-alanine N-acetyltransferase